MEPGTASVFGVLYAPAPHEALIDIAREFSPRVTVESAHPREVVLDLSGLARLFGDPCTMAEEMVRTATAHGVDVRVAIAGSRIAARLLVRGARITVVPPGGEAAAVAPLPIERLAHIQHPDGVAAAPAGRGRSADADEPRDVVMTLGRWGIRTLGAFAALPAHAVAARLGQRGVQWQRMAQGLDRAPLVPTVPEERFEEALDLEWPIEGLEPLSFVLGRLLEPLSARLERRDRGAAVLHVRLHLVTRAVHERSLQLPVAMREARTLRTLILLDLESHPPPAAIDRVVVAVDPTPGRIVQFSLLTRPLPSPEQVSTLMARLQALMGESRCGSPAVVDSWEPGAFSMKPFAPVEPNAGDPLAHRDTAGGDRRSIAALRRFRHPVIARVRVEAGTPVRVVTDRAGIPGGRVESSAGPWRTSGAWWLDGATPGTTRNRWDRDEWDVELSDGATYRIFRERHTERWFVEGVVD